MKLACGILVGCVALLCGVSPPARAAETPPPTTAQTNSVPCDPRAGRWEGRWEGGKVLGGVLTCELAPVGEDAYEARFGAKVLGLFPYRYDVCLSGSDERGRFVFEGTKDLGLTRGGVYRFTGAIEGDVLECTFESAVYRGIFRLRKSVEASGPPATPQVSNAR